MTVEAPDDPVGILALQAAVIANAIGDIQLALARSRECIRSVSQQCTAAKLVKSGREIGNLAVTFRKIHELMPQITTEIHGVIAVVNSAANLAHMTQRTAQF